MCTQIDEGSAETRRPNLETRFDAEEPKLPNGLSPFQTPGTNTRTQSSGAQSTQVKLKFNESFESISVIIRYNAFICSYTIQQLLLCFLPDHAVDAKSTTGF